MRSSVRWLVPLSVAVVVAGGLAVSSAQAGNAPEVPPSTPEKVLASIAGSSVTALSGTIVTRADVGLPSLGDLAPRSGDATDPAGLVTRFLSGRNTVRVWLDGPTKQRAQLLDPFSELDVVRNGDQVWSYASRGNRVQHGTLPAHAGTGAHAGPATAPADLTPAQLAQRALAAAGPTTDVTLGEPELVASRKAYALTLTPRTDTTLVGRVVIAVDAERGVPLQVQVFPRGKARPAIETGFTSVDFGTPAADRFSFTPPAGATVTELGTAPASVAKPSLPASARPKVIGTGWTSIVEVPAAALNRLPDRRVGSAGTEESPTPGQAGAGTGLAGLQQLTTPTSAGRGLTTSLVSVLFTNDGRILAGAVPLPALVTAAAAR
jgi:outer membrane lipoprotein-sorting protein